MNIMEEYQNYPDPDGAYAAAELQAEWYQEMDAIERRAQQEREYEARMEARYE